MKLLRVQGVASATIISGKHRVKILSVMATFAGWLPVDPPFLRIATTFGDVVAESAGAEMSTIGVVSCCIGTTATATSFSNTRCTLPLPELETDCDTIVTVTSGAGAVATETVVWYELRPNAGAE